MYHSTQMMYICTQYLQWAKMLFTKMEHLTASTPIIDTKFRLQKPILLYVAPWYENSVSFSGLPNTIAGVKYALISLGGQHFRNSIFNIDGI